VSPPPTAGDPVPGQPQGLPAHVRRRRLAVLAGALVVLVWALTQLGAGNGSRPLEPPPPGGIAGAPAADLLAFRAGREAAYSERAAAGSAQVVFLKSPGGILATAARVARYRGLIDATAQGSGIPPALLEGLVFLESAGRPEVIAGGDPADAAGLTQILAGTGQSLLGMQINLARSRRLTAAINAAATTTRVDQLEAQRAAIDTRFDPARALAATVRYLEIAERDLGGRADLAVAAYHAGIGNLQQVLNDYDGGVPVSYARLYFDISPVDHVAAWRLLSGLGDDSSLYYWRVLAAERIMQLYRTSPAELRRLNGLETAYPSTAEVLVPPATTPSFADPAALSAGYRDGRLQPLPANLAALHLAASPLMGALAPRLRVPASLYRGLRPAALTMLLEIASLVHRISGTAAPLVIASTVLDARYDHRLGFDDPPATTGYTFQIERRYGSGAQAEALQFVLDRLQALNLIAWIRGDSTIEITVAPDAGVVLAHGV
jgi:hypothetical protein